ncbi:class I SAM-dependent methyltransferase [Caulobacter sp. ErkDOM-E]|uniref:class I SAM-dependent methyltransferase n=1 Tax=Caulobacter sp. ErkDOM-E TaxID=3402778 RepID=UPI003AF4F475
MAPTTRPYYSSKGLSAVHYDLLTAADKTLSGDLDVYAGLAKGPSQILELGAGTGRIALELAKRGHSVLGLDIAPAMLDQAEAKRKALDPETAARLRFKLGDMASLSLGETFDLVLCTYFTLAHVPAGASWRNTFKGVARHLKPGGLAAFHLPLEDRMREAPPPSDKPVFLHALEGGGHVALYILEHGFNPKLGRMDLVLDFVTKAAPGAAATHSHERLTYYLADPVPFAQAAGLEVAMAPIDISGVGAIHVFRKP